MAFSTDDGLWQEFLRVWPFDRLRTMTLADYTTAGDKDCFVYWMESRLEDYGSIWGGSAFKFGIYSRNATSVEEGDSSRAYDDHYGWYRKFGDTAEEAFAAVRTHVVAVAEAASAGRFENIDASPLGNAYRWKIAFHYQSLQTPLIPCVYVRKPLLHSLGMPASDMTTLQSTLYRSLATQRRPGEFIGVFSERLWKEWVLNMPCVVKLGIGAIKNGYLSVNLVSAPFPESMYGGNTEAEAADAAHFRTDTGREFDSDIRVVGSGGSGRLRERLTDYFTEIGAQPGDSITISQQADGSYLLSAKVRSSAAGTSQDKTAQVAGSKQAPTNMPNITKPPLNQILFGPPGTGKTYQAVEKALEILDPEFISGLGEDSGDGERRTALKARYDELVAAKRVRFVTFHQSFSYEDFVEGLRADNSDAGQLQYRVEPGVFKAICDDARGAAHVASEVGIRDGARIWKISIDGTGMSPTRDYCFAHDEARIGWGEVGDLRDVDVIDRTGYQQLGSHDRNTLQAFSSEMQPGDVVLCIGSAFSVQAIGVVQGEYTFEKSPPQGVRKDYGNVLPVRWLAVDLALDLRPLNGGVRFTLKTVYELSRFSWTELGNVIAEVGIKLKGLTPTQQRQALDHVLIIDEINRGNVSRIFGELITLIEPSKRAGDTEHLQVTLPYSKKPFDVPKQIYLIGTMNTADRSLAGLDIALRRRFQFMEVPPEPGKLAGLKVAGIDLSAMLEVMNRRIEVLLGRDHQLGHAYFMSLANGDELAKLASIFRNQILPLLQEYFFEDWQRIAWVLNDHRKSKGFQFVVPPTFSTETLFGIGTDVQIDAKLWRLDEEAFKKVESYLGILGDGKA